MKTDITIGLFGTCDNVRWRDSFMARYQELGISYFNPMVDNWSHELVEIENNHLVNDKIVLFPVLKESLGYGSLGEIGFSIMNTIRNHGDRFLMILIDDQCDPIRVSSAEQIKASVNARKLVKSKVLAVDAPNVYLVESLDQMMDISILLHNICAQKSIIDKKYRIPR